MPKIVNVYVMRHGDKTREPGGDQAILTPKGVKQVQSSALSHLNGIQFQAAACSGLPRTKETATLVMQTTGQNITITNDPRLGFSGINLEEYLQADEKIRAKAKELGRVPTVADWLEGLPFMRFIKKRLTEAILEHAQAAAEAIQEGKTGNVFFASHSPTGEMAVIFPEETELLHEAEIICYTVVIEDDGSALIVANRYYPYAG